MIKLSEGKLLAVVELSANIPSTDARNKNWWGCRWYPQEEFICASWIFSRVQNLCPAFVTADDLWTQLDLAVGLGAAVQDPSSCNLL